MMRKLSIICFAPWVLVGCNDPARNVGQKIRNVTVGTVVDQNITLDTTAEPRQVAYVLLCAVRDDMEAKDAAAREAAFDRQLALCAPDSIFARTYRKSFGRDESVQRIVWRWAPTLGHYVRDFPRSWADAEKRLVIAKSVKDAGPAETTVERAHVMIELASPDANADSSVIAQFQLVREQGYWRVTQVGFVKDRRHFKASQKSAPTETGDAGSH